MMKTTGIILVSTLAFGCATQRFGREEPVNDAEKRVLTCDQIDLELAKTESFLKNTTDQSAKFTGKDVLGFLGDFGIGNAMEYNDAMKSGTTRLSQLSNLQTERNCVRNRLEAQK